MPQDKQNPLSVALDQMVTDLNYLTGLLSGRQQPQVAVGGNPPPVIAPNNQPAVQQQQPTTAAQPNVNKQKVQAGLAQLAYLLGGISQALTPQWSWQSQLGQFGQTIGQQQLVNLLMNQSGGGLGGQNPR